MDIIMSINTLRYLIIKNNKIQNHNDNILTPLFIKKSK